GDVIPEIVMAILEKRPAGAKHIEFPTLCPDCGAEVVRLDDQAIARCVGGLSCRAQCAERIKHFASRRAMNIEGLGSQWVDKLVDAKVLNTVADIYQLTEEKLLAFPRTGEKSVHKLLEAIGYSKNTTFGRFLFALGIFGVGETTAQRLADHYGHMTPLTKATEEELQTIDDVGPILAESIVAFFHDKHNRSMIEALMAAGVQYPKQEKKAGGHLSGTQYVITGTLSMPRDVLKQQLEALGAKVSESVSKHTTAVIVGEKPGSKYDKAVSLNIPIWTEADALKAIVSCN
ncbi:MAG: helix-hairpin-helix domain-containing protein, partial [Pseudomonadota bacterium]